MSFIKLYIFILTAFLLSSPAFANGQTLYGDIVLDSLKSKATLGTDSNGKIILGTGGGSSQWTTTGTDIANNNAGNVNVATYLNGVPKSMPSSLYFQTMADSSGNGNTATAYSDSLRVTGKFGNGVYFDQTNMSYIQTPNLGSFPNTGTIAFWFYPQTVSTNMMLFTTTGFNTNTGMRLQLGGSDIYLTIGDDVGYTSGNTVASGVTVGWHHVAVTWNVSLNYVKFYYDGSPTFTSYSFNYWPSSFGQIIFGAGGYFNIYSPPQNLIGKLDDIGVWNVSQSDTTISYIQTNPIPSGSDQLAIYHMEDTSPTVTPTVLNAINNVVATGISLPTDALCSNYGSESDCVPANCIWTDHCIAPTNIIPSLGQGTRLSWSATRGSFRAGRAVGSEWDDSNQGLFSAAFGHNVKASGTGTFVAGDQCEATQPYGVAIGYNNHALGLGCYALGTTNYCYGGGSIAMGRSNISSADGCVAIGYNGQCNAQSGFVTGDASVCNGSGAIAMGASCYANGGGSIAMGFSCVANGGGSIAMGNGAQTAQLASGALASGFQTVAFGPTATSIGNNSIASNSSSTAIGNRAFAAMPSSLSTGFGTLASGMDSASFNNDTLASGFSSSAFGEATQSLGKASFVTGSTNIVKGQNSSAFGRDCTVSSDNSICINLGTDTGTSGSCTNGYFECSTVTDSGVCGTHSSCYWDGTNCSNSGPQIEPCGQITQLTNAPSASDACGKMAGCSWDGTTCSPVSACTALSTRDTCQGQTGCTWNATFASNPVTVAQNGTVAVMNAKLGIGTATPKKSLEVKDDDVYINKTSGKLIMKSPDGTCSSCGPSNLDVWTCTGVTCP